MVASHTRSGVPIVTKKQLKDIEAQASLERWQEELARHVAYLPILCELANVDEGELHRAIEIHFYVRSMSKGAMQ
jgi:hypothetical protein